MKIVRTGQLFHGADDFLHVVAPQRAGAHLVRIDPGARAKQAKQQRLARHFQGEDADDLLVVDRRIFGDVHGESGLAHRRARGEDDQVGLLQAARHFVEIGVVRGESGDALATLQQGIDRPEGFLDDFRYAQKAASNALFRELEDGGFRIVENVFGCFGLLGGACNRGVGGVDQSAQQCLVANDLDVVLDAGPVGNAVEQR